eukprot:TRINITY_DN7033_c0_g1_i1.p1 TRINITY_DN7033_c0_g1~~TRINITY_DN7033_c0_g1_i1.p1  ORF type:complete len:140 (-),score=14.81 TRINITY_DN7033_c0_g1_i1:254-673(-)
MSTIPSVPANAFDGRVVLDYKYSLFSCMDEPKVCLAAYCFPCFLLGEMNAWTWDKAHPGVLDYWKGCSDPTTFPRLWVIWRNRRGMSEPGFFDNMQVLCASCCSLIQTYREMRELKESGHLPRDVRKIVESVVISQSMK